MNSLIRQRSFVGIFLACLSLVQIGFAAKKVTIGIVTDGPSAQSEAIRKAFLDELKALTEQEFVIDAPATKQWNGQWSAAKITSALDQADADPSTDVVLVLGLAASQQSAKRRNFRKPTFAPFVANALSAVLPRKGLGSGIANLNYLTTQERFIDQIKYFQGVVPFQRLAVLMDEALYQSTLDFCAGLIEEARRSGIELRIIRHVGDRDFASRIPADAQVVALTPLPRLHGEDRQALIQSLLKRKLPSFSLSGDAEVAEGFLLSNVSSIDLGHRTRQTSLNMHAVLRGQKAGDQPVLFERKSQVTMNMATARAIGFSPRWETIQTAVLLNEEPGAAGAPLRISEAAQEAVRANLDIIAGQLGVKAGEGEVKRVRSVLFPQLVGDLDYALRRDDYPTITSGLMPKEQFAASLTLNQILFSESALANLSIQKKLQIALEAQQRTLELDIVQQAVNSFLAVLTANSDLQVQKNGLNLAQSNWQLAKSRVAAGKADASDVSRWESEIATARQKVLSAKATLEQSRDRLNRLLRRSLKDRYPLQPAALNDPQLLISRPEFSKTVDNDRAFSRMTEFFVKEGMALSPDLAELEARVKAAERQLKSDQIQFFAPDLSLTGEGFRVLNEVRVPGGSVGSSLQLEDKNYWALGLNLSLPILEGGGRLASISKSRAVLEQLQTQRDSLRQGVEQSIRDHLHALQASIPSIRLSKEAADAARRTYQLVSKNYARGTRSVVDLLDAQNASLIADQSAASAVFVAMTDLMNLQRSMGGFTYLSDRQRLDDTMKRLQAYVAQSGN